MPLSESERHQLEQLEQQLKDDDPKLAARISSGKVTRRPNSMLILGSLIGVVGVAVLLAGVFTHIIVLGVVGFLLMGTGAYCALPRIISPRR